MFTRRSTGFGRKNSTQQASMLRSLKINFISCTFFSFFFVAVSLILWGKILVCGVIARLPTVTGRENVLTSPLL